MLLQLSIVVAMHLLFHSRGCVQLKHFPDTRALFLQTDTASVLQETIGYIRFLLGQIEVQSLSLSLLGLFSQAVERGEKLTGHGHRTSRKKYGRSKNVPHKSVWVSVPSL
jgi:hypothetical protein